MIIPFAPTPLKISCYVHLFSDPFPLGWENTLFPPLSDIAIMRGNGAKIRLSSRVCHVRTIIKISVFIIIIKIMYRLWVGGQHICHMHLNALHAHSSKRYPHLAFVIFSQRIRSEVVTMA